MRRLKKTGADDQQRRSDSILETVESVAEQTGFPLRRIVDHYSYPRWGSLRNRVRFDCGRVQKRQSQSLKSMVSQS